VNLDTFTDSFFTLSYNIIPKLIICLLDVLTLLRIDFVFEQQRSQESLVSGVGVRVDDRSLPEADLKTLIGVGYRKHTLVAEVRKKHQEIWRTEFGNVAREHICTP
jgi:hypothetical protein